MKNHKKKKKTFYIIILKQTNKQTAISVFISFNARNVSEKPSLLANDALENLFNSIKPALQIMIHKFNVCKSF